MCICSQFSSYECFIPNEWIPIERKRRKSKIAEDDEDDDDEDDDEAMEGVKLKIHRLSHCLHFDEAEELTKSWSLQARPSLGRHEGSFKIERKRKAATRNESNTKRLKEATEEAKEMSRITSLVENNSLGWCGIRARDKEHMIVDNVTGTITIPSKVPPAATTIQSSLPFTGEDKGADLNHTVSVQQPNGRSDLMLSLTPAQPTQTTLHHKDDQRDEGGLEPVDVRGQMSSFLTTTNYELKVPEESPTMMMCGSNEYTDVRVHNELLTGEHGSNGIATIANITKTSKEQAANIIEQYTESQATQYNGHQYLTSNGYSNNACATKSSINGYNSTGCATNASNGCTATQEWNNVSHKEKPVIIKSSQLLMPSTDSFTTIAPVNAKMPLLCDGGFIWWNIETEGLKIKEIPKSQYASDLFNNMSRYGTVKVSASIKSIIQCYKAHFENKEESKRETSNGWSHSNGAIKDNNETKRRILFKRGGTLGYKHETCYIIIVCMTGTDGTDPLPQFNNLHFTEEDIEREEEECNGTATNGIPVFINSPYSMINGETVRWDQYKLAFHFPTEKEANAMLRLNPKDIDISFVKHSIYRRTGGGGRGGASKPVPVPWCLHYFKCSDYQMNKKEMKRKKEKLLQIMEREKSKKDD